MRAFAISSVKAVMLVQPRVTPGAVGLVIAISGMSAVPSTALTTPATLPLWMQCAQSVGDRLPGRLTISSRVAVDIAIADGRDRPPEIVMVLGVQHGDGRIRDPDRHQRHEPRAVDDAHLLGDHELACERVISHRRTDEPKAGNLGLLDRSLGTDLSAVLLELVIVGCPLLAIQSNRRGVPEFSALRHGERAYSRSPMK